jgi:hypothetical protein
MYLMHSKRGKLTVRFCTLCWTRCSLRSFFFALLLYMNPEVSNNGVVWLTRRFPGQTQGRPCAVHRVQQSSRAAGRAHRREWRARLALQLRSPPCCPVDPARCHCQCACDRWIHARYGRYVRQTLFARLQCVCTATKQAGTIRIGADCLGPVLERPFRRLRCFPLGGLACAWGFEVWEPNRQLTAVAAWRLRTTAGYMPRSLYHGVSGI